MAAGVASIVAPAVLRGAEPTADPVRVGHIGTGTRGWDLIKYTGNIPEAKVVAVCDVYGPHLQRGIEACNNPDAKQYTKYQDLLADPDVEAVIIAAPDHWHEQMAIDAANAGKAVYCEKGLTMSVDSAKRMREVIRKQNTVFQLGHQGRQHPATATAGDLMRGGRLGPITLVKTGRFFNGTLERAPWRWYGNYTWWDRPDPNEVIKQLDWEAWLGSTPKIDFNERHFWHWRCYWAYGTGQAGDLLSHEMDHVQCVLGWGIPDTCACTGQLTYYKDDREIPDNWLAAYTFEKQNCTVTFEGCMNSNRQQAPEYIGKSGRLTFNGIGQDAVTYGIWDDKPAYPFQGNVLEPVERFDPSKTPQWPTHMQDFLRCVRTGERPKCNIDEAFIEVVTLLMSVESYKQKREVRWDAAAERIV
ncbi:MAG: Gfo/Idh/MocA family oxidoreductase [Candidatus Hydrogenedentes bacterium]|nr:Gfo/Idh/MocA family oxidoreductase [Candidatus Hydrogenedentota bacterium]